jgi:hypothetical protein
MSAQPGGRQRQHRPQPLAAGGNDVARQLGDQRDRALHVLDDQLVDPVQVVAHQLGQAFQRVWLVAPGFQIDDDRHAIPFRRHRRHRLEPVPLRRPGRSIAWCGAPVRSIMAGYGNAMTTIDAALW